jgi:hypothetical protein
MIQSKYACTLRVKVMCRINFSSRIDNNLHICTNQNTLLKLTLATNYVAPTTTLDPEGASITLQVFVLKARAIPAAKGSPRRSSGNNFLTSSIQNIPKKIKTFDGRTMNFNKHFASTCEHFVELSRGAGEQIVLGNLELLLVGDLSHTYQQNNKNRTVESSQMRALDAEYLAVLTSS